MRIVVSIIAYSVKIFLYQDNIKHLGWCGMGLNSRFFILALGGFLVASCSSLHHTEFVESDSNLEKVNKTSYNAVDLMDQYLLKPVAHGYQFVMPDSLRYAVDRAFGNVREVTTVANDLLQGKLEQAVHDSSRVLVNSTLGVGGLFEVAESMGLAKNDPEDFGQTLAVWGIPAGPYIYVPGIGPSTLRDMPSKFVDYLFNPIAYIEHSRSSYMLSGLRLLQGRVGLISVEEVITGDRYQFIKDAYLQRRQYLIKDGKLSDELDDFGADF